MRVSSVLLERLDGLAAMWNVPRASAVRRLIEDADAGGVAPLGTPTMDELMRIASEKARSGNVAALNFIAARLPDEREHELQLLLARLGAADQ